ncbi:MAG TPA: ABC transporter permease, partial [Anaerolineae bacterium]
MKQNTLWSWLIIVIGILYFFIPLVATLEFAMRIRRGAYTFDAFQIVLNDPTFAATFSYSVILALATIVFGILLLVPTAYWIQLRL